MSVRAAQAKGKRSAAPQTGLRVVRRARGGLIKRSTNRRMAPLGILAILLIGATVATVLLEQVVLAQTGFKMAQLRDRVVVAEARHAELVLRAARLGSPERIERVAIQELGMTYPAPSEVKYIVANVRQKGGTKLAVNNPRFQFDGEAQAAGVAP